MGFGVPVGSSNPPKEINDILQKSSINECQDFYAVIFTGNEFCNNFLNDNFIEGHLFVRHMLSE